MIVEAMDKNSIMKEKWITEGKKKKDGADLEY